MLWRTMSDVAWRSVKVWMNAFIPRVVDGYTLDVPKGAHVGKTMIPGPFPTSDCFLTDQRSFSNDVHAKSRMHCEANVDFLAARPTLGQWHNCDQTTECDCDDGDEECTEKGKNAGNFTMVLEADKIILKLNANASNPCAPSSAFGGAIDLQARFEIDRKLRTLTFEGIVDAFPAFEAYAGINNGSPTTIFRREPPKGNTVMNLPGGPSVKVERIVLEDTGTAVFRRKELAGSGRFIHLARRVDLFQTDKA
jgi:hypothetical protein